MSNIEKKKSIIDDLLAIKNIENHTKHYKYILDIVKNNNVNITKNKRGYYFNLNNLSNESIEIIYDYLKKVIEKD
jgi:DNA-directed RNA polymerase subunit F